MTDHQHHLIGHFGSLLGDPAPVHPALPPFEAQRRRHRECCCCCWCCCCHLLLLLLVTRQAGERIEEPDSQTKE